MNGRYESKDGFVWRDGEVLLNVCGAGPEVADAVASALHNEGMDTAEKIADLIRAETRGLDHEDTQAVTHGLKNHARAKKYRDLDRAKINGYRIALSYVLGCPLDMAKTDAFIEQKDYWEAL